MSRRRPKVPQAPGKALGLEPGDVVHTAPFLWRVHRTVGPHVLAWDGLREYGPLPSMRWDPQPLPCGPHPGEGVLYAATDVETAVAEVYQGSRHVDLESGMPRLTGWRPTRELRLLDLTGDWASRQGAAHALTAAPRRTCQAWARAVRVEMPDIDGLWTPSTLTGRPVVALFTPAGTTFPTAPEMSESLTTPEVASVVRSTARRIGYSGW